MALGIGPQPPREPQKPEPAKPQTPAPPPPPPPPPKQQPPKQQPPRQQLTAQPVAQPAITKEPEITKTPEKTATPEPARPAEPPADAPAAPPAEVIIHEAPATAGLGKGRRLGIGFTVGIYVISAIAIWTVIAILSSTYIPAPWDVTHIRTFTLAPETKDLLKRLNQPLRITSLFTEDGALKKLILSEVVDVVDLFKIESSRIYFQQINPDRDPAAANELIARTKVDPDESNYKNGIVVEYGSRATLIPLKRISLVEAVTISRVRMLQEKAFHGEHALASAILNLIEEQRPNIDFVLGHGEMDIEDPNVTKGLLYGKNALLEEKMNVRQLFLLEKLKIPEETQVVAIMGPTEAFSAPEIAEIQKFLERGGGLFLATDPGRHTGLENLLNRYGIEIGRNFVIDASQKKSGAKRSTMLVKKTGDHPIVSPLSTSNIMIANTSTVSKSAATGALVPRLVRTELLLSSDRAWGEVDFTNRNPVFAPEQGDMKGPLCYAMAAEVTPNSSDPKAAARGGTRIVVAGSKDMFSNFAFVDFPANGDLFQNIINWLSKRDRMSSVRPRTPDIRTFTLTEEQAQRLAMAAYAGVPTIFAIIGFLIWWRRRA